MPRAPEHLLRTAFVFDDLRVLFAPVPKAGSTAILRALAEVVGLKPEDFARSRKLEVTRSLAVHDGAVWGSSYRLEGRSADALDEILGSGDWLRVTVVREPGRRLWSAWVSKVLVRDPRFVSAFGESWFPAVPATAHDILGSFRTFVRTLPEVDRHDPHWLPQADLVGAGAIEYDHVGRVEELDRTAAVLGERVSSWGRTLPALRRENPTILPFTPAVFDRLALAACTHWTEPDRAAFGYEPLAPVAEEPEAAWFAAVEAAIPAVRAVIERNERFGDLHRLLDEGDPGSRPVSIRGFLRRGAARSS